MKKFGIVVVAVLFIALFAAVYFLTDSDGGGDTPAPPPNGVGTAPAGTDSGTDLVKTPNFAVPAGIQRPDSRGGNRADWEEEISEALANDQISNEEAVQRLLSLSYDTKVDDETRQEALEHSLNLTEDKAFAQVMPLFKNKNTPVDMLDGILSDLYNRGDRVKLEAVLEVARIDDHPMKEDALELLEFYVDENYGTDWNQWGAAVQSYLKENVDDIEAPEPAPAPAPAAALVPAPAPAE